MIGKIFRKLIGKTEPEKEEEISTSIAQSIREKSQKIIDTASEKFQNATREFFDIKQRLENLRESNYKLGLKHLENGHIKDAIFRFRFINYKWPDLLDAYYQLAYCLTLDNKPHEAKIVLKKLLAHHPEFDPKAAELLEHIEHGLNQKSFDE